jgi:hypothetical protein
VRESQFLYYVAIMVVESDGCGLSRVTAMVLGRGKGCLVSVTFGHSFPAPILSLPGVIRAEGGGRAEGLSPA